MGLVAHPDRSIGLGSDLYVHVTSIPADADTAQPKIKVFEERLSPGDSVLVGNALVVLGNIVQVKDEPAFAGYTLVAKAKLSVLAQGKRYETEPVFIVDGNEAKHIDSRIDELGLVFSFAGADPKANKIVLNIGQEILPPDYITFKAIRKPYINLLWLGTFVLAFGFGLAVYRRWAHTLPDDEPAAT
jgi:cytochrome c-type biogenesis protein CcmF